MIALSRHAQARGRRAALLTALLAATSCTALRARSDRPDVRRGDGAASDAPEFDAPDADATTATDATPDAQCDPDASTAPAVRPIAPLSGSLIAHPRPRFTWAAATPGVALVFELARTRAFASVEHSAPVSAGATAFTPAAALARGAWFWRVRAAAPDPCAPPARVWQVQVVATDSTASDRARGWTADFNGDGRADIAAGAPGTSSRGQVLVYYGPTDGASAPGTDLRPTGPGVREAFGYAVANAGDMDGDGFVDLAVGAPDTDGGAGRVLVYRGSATGVVTTAPWTIDAPTTALTRRFGRAAAPAGDLNGDGYADLVVGAGDWGDSPGGAYIYLGRAAGPRADLRADATLPDPVGRASLFAGRAVGPGDLDGDGFDDLVVNAEYEPSVPGDMPQTGAVYLYFGSADSRMIASSRVRVPPPLAAMGGHFGIGIAGLGDVNRDGLADFAAGADYTSPGGNAYVFYGNRTRTGIGTPVLTIAGPDTTTAGHFGFTIAGGGDLNGDQRVDLAISQERLNQAWVHLGTAAGEVPPTPASPALRFGGGFDGFGFALAMPGDLDGDGFGDLLAGTPGYLDDGGLVAVYRGSAAGLSGAPDFVLRGTERGKLGFALAGAM